VDQYANFVRDGDKCKMNNVEMWTFDLKDMGFGFIKRVGANDWELITRHLLH
jgi:hypothetical protein